MIRTWHRWASLLVGCAALLISVTGLAGRLKLDITPGGKDFPLALPAPQSSGATDKASDEIWAVVRRDLEMTGYFRIIDPNAYIEQSGGVEPGTFDFGNWRMIKAAALAKTRVLPSGSGVRADVYIYDVGTGEKIDAKGYVGDTADVRYLGHRIADAILLAITGEPGFFGSRLAVVGSKSGKKEIYRMDMDGMGVTAITNNGTINLSPAWSPSGGQVAFTSYRRNNADVYIKDVKSGRLRPISEKPGMDSGAAWSPDGTKIALSRSEAGETDIFIIDASTGAEIQRVTKVSGIDVSPSWSPDGRKLAFASERSGGSQVYIQDLASGSATRVTFQGGFNSDPVFSPDGSKIAFVGRDGRFDVFVVGVDGKNMVRITQNQGDNEDPAWSPDGRYLVFSSTRRSRSEIWLSTEDGRHQSPVTDGTGGWTQPAWAP